MRRVVKEATLLSTSTTGIWNFGTILFFLGRGGGLEGLKLERTFQEERSVAVYWIFGKSLERYYHMLAERDGHTSRAVSQPMAYEGLM